MVFSLVRLSAVDASHDERQWQCYTWMTDPRYAQRRYIVRIKMDANSSFFVYPSFMPNTQAMLSVRILMWQFRSFDRMRIKGRRIAIISRVVVLFPNRLSRLSLFFVMKFFGHHSW